MQRIESTRNELVKVLRTLDTAKGRMGTGLFLIEGEKLVKDALAAGWPIEHCLYIPAYGDLAQDAGRAGAQVYSVSDAVLEAVCTTKTPQGVVLAARLPGGVVVGNENAPLLALDGVQDPGNVGAMIRTAEAAGFSGVLLGAGCADPYAPKAVRGSMGSALRVPVEQTEALAGRLQGLREAGWCVAGTAMEGVNFFARPKLPAKRVLVIGSEGKGIGREVLSVCDHTFTLPMAGKAQSLNAAVAAGIMMFDWFRETL